MENQEDFSMGVQYIDLAYIQGPREVHIYSYGNQYPLCVHFSEQRDQEKFLQWLEETKTPVH